MASLVVALFFLNSGGERFSTICSSFCHRCNIAFRDRNKPGFRYGRAHLLIATFGEVRDHCDGNHRKNATLRHLYRKFLVERPTLIYQSVLEKQDAAKRAAPRSESLRMICKERPNALCASSTTANAVKPAAARKTNAFMLRCVGSRIM